jgi:hypothetical protein
MLGSGRGLTESTISVRSWRKWRKPKHAFQKRPPICTPDPVCGQFIITLVMRENDLLLTGTRANYLRQTRQIITIIYTTNIYSTCKLGMSFCLPRGRRFRTKS